MCWDTESSSGRHSSSSSGPPRKQKGTAGRRSAVSQRQPPANFVNLGFLDTQGRLSTSQLPSPATTSCQTALRPKADAPTRAILDVCSEYLLQTTGSSLTAFRTCQHMIPAREEDDTTRVGSSSHTLRRRGEDCKGAAGHSNIANGLTKTKTTLIA
jgi:hypothetical protein